MAEKEGFEPPVELPLQLISSQSHSTTLALLRIRKAGIKGTLGAIARIEWRFLGPVHWTDDRFGLE